MPWFLVECYERDGVRSDRRIEAKTPIEAQDRAKQAGLIVGSATLEPRQASIKDMVVTQSAPVATPSAPAIVRGLTTNEQILAELQAIRTTLDRSTIMHTPGNKIFSAVFWAIVITAIIFGILGAIVQCSNESRTRYSDPFQQR